MDTTRISKFVFIESLGESEFKTGSLLAEYLSGLTEEASWPTTVDHYFCPGVDGVRDALENVLRQSRSDELPWIHIDAHGSDESGLWFADDTSMEWTEFCASISPINEATGFKLFLFISTCHGAAIVSGISTFMPAPCVALIGPTHEIDPGELYNRCMAFYRTMVTTKNINQAFSAATDAKLEKGRFAVVTAELWWRELLIRYLRESTDPARIDQISGAEFVRRQAAGIPADLEDIKQTFWERLPNTILGFFDTYFMTSKIPENSLRFSGLKKELVEELDAIRMRIHL